MAAGGPAAVPTRVEYGSLIIFHDSSTNTVLLGEEGLNLFNELDKKHPFFRYNIGIISACLHPNTGGVAGAGRQKTLEELTLEYIPIFKQNVNSVWSKRPDFIKGLSIKDLDTYTNVLYPIVARERTQCTSPLIRYFSNPRVRNPIKTNGFPKGGIKTDKLTGRTETPLECIQREVYEEIGNIDPNLLNSAINIGISTAIYGDNISNYTIYYKPVSPSERRDIETAIRNRYANSIGESFDLGFKNIQGLHLNYHSKNAIVMCNTYFASLPGAPNPPPKLLGGAKKTRRRTNRKRRTTSRRR
jgi:hypothetical protein